MYAHTTHVGGGAQRRCGDVERGRLLPVFLRAPGKGHLLWRVHGRYFLRGTADQGSVRVDDAQHAGGSAFVSLSLSRARALSLSLCIYLSIYLYVCMYVCMYVYR